MSRRYDVKYQYKYLPFYKHMRAHMPFFFILSFTNIFFFGRWTVVKYAGELSPILSVNCLQITCWWTVLSVNCLGTLIDTRFLSLIRCLLESTLISSDNFREEKEIKLVRAISAESIYHMLLSLDHILYRRAHFSHIFIYLPIMLNPFLGLVAYFKYISLYVTFPLCSL